MTVRVWPQTRLRSLAAHVARALLQSRSLFDRRAQGRPGAGSHPRSAARNAHARQTAQQHTGVAVHTAFPARWSDGLCRDLPGAELSFWPPSPRELPMPSAQLGSRTSPQRLDRGNDGQDHTVLPYAAHPARPKRLRRTSAPLVRTKPRAHRDYPPCPRLSRTTLPRPPQPGPRFERLANRPSSSGRAASSYAAIPNFGKVEYFCGEGLTGYGVFCPTGRARVPDAQQRAALLRRAGTHESHGDRREMDPGSAAHR